MLRYINETRHAHVITVEDPIEFLFEPGNCMIIQREIGTDTDSFRDALTAAMRQDPDVIMVGEIRDARDRRDLPQGGRDRPPRHLGHPHPRLGLHHPALRRHVRRRRART